MLQNVREKGNHRKAPNPTATSMFLSSPFIITVPCFLPRNLDLESSTQPRKRSGLQFRATEDWV